MCSGCERQVPAIGKVMMEGAGGVGIRLNFSVLLELSASDDLIGFKRAIEEEGRDIDELGMWYGRRIGSKKMGFEERTPLMIAAMFGSREVVEYIIESGRVDVNRACGSDGATALHCAAAGGSRASHEVVKVLIDASADIKCVNAYGNRPGDVIASCLSLSSKPVRKALEFWLKGVGVIEDLFADSGKEFDVVGGEKTEEGLLAQQVSSEGVVSGKKEYPVDPSLPDIKNGIYGTDEFRMYTFKVKPCSRAYSHDWTECPFVHPGENARRRDPRKYHYSCVPCPEFRKGSCSKGDTCEYAHGIFECWLHPAQYRTRLCKDETSCSRRVCFFAHKPEELRPLYASTGSAVPSPRSFSMAASFDMSSITPLALGSPSLLMTTNTSTPPLTPTSVSSPMAGALWQNQLLDITPPTLQLPGSRLKTGFNARDINMDAELLGLENQRRRQQLLEEINELSSPTKWNSSFHRAAAFGSSADRIGDLGGLKPTNLDDGFGSLDPVLMSRLQGLSLDAAAAAQLSSPTAMQSRQIMNQQLLSGYTSGFPLTPTRASVLSSSAFRASSFGVDPPGSPSAASLLSSRSAAFAKRSQSFIDRSAVNRFSGLSSPTALGGGAMCSHLSDWGSSDGKLDWGIQGDELSKLRKSASFGIRNGGSSIAKGPSLVSSVDEPDISWVSKPLDFDEQPGQYQPNNKGPEAIPPWVEQLYMEQEQVVA
ncbi:hypothetical protein Droror1_Dr00019167 [Drosera rotundifolia]